MASGSSDFFRGGGNMGAPSTPYPNEGGRSAADNFKFKTEGETKMRVKSNMKAGALSGNHNQTVKGLRVKSSVKAGGVKLNHSQTVTR